MITHEIELGAVNATRGVVAWIGESVESRSRKVSEALTRHRSGDWGEVCEEDKVTNDASAANGWRIISAYTLDGTKVWVITEWDRSVTTVLFPEEY